MMDQIHKVVWLPECASCQNKARYKHYGTGRKYKGCRIWRDPQRVMRPCRAHFPGIRKKVAGRVSGTVLEEAMGRLLRHLAPSDEQPVGGHIAEGRYCNEPGMRVRFVSQGDRKFFSRGEFALNLMKEEKEAAANALLVGQGQASIEQTVIVNRYYRKPCPEYPLGHCWEAVGKRILREYHTPFMCHPDVLRTQNERPR